MAKEGLAPEDAYERVVLQSAQECGLCDSEPQELYGFSAGAEAQPVSASPNEAAQPRDLKRWEAPQTPTTEGREPGPSDSEASGFDPGVTLAAGGGTRSGPDWRALQEILRHLFRGLKPQQPPAQQQPPQPPTQPLQPKGPTLQPPPQSPQPPQQPPAPAPPQPQQQLPPSQQPPLAPPPPGEVDLPRLPPLEHETDFGQRSDAGGDASGSSVVRPVQPGYQSPAEILAPGGKFIGRPGENSGIRELPGGAAAAQELFERLTRGAGSTRLTDKSLVIDLPEGGGFIGLRLTSKSGPPTIDINIPGVGVRELKFPEGYGQ
jgi:hypothetical protein